MSNYYKKENMSLKIDESIKDYYYNSYTYNRLIDNVYALSQNKPIPDCLLHEYEDYDLSNNNEFEQHEVFMSVKIILRDGYTLTVDTYRAKNPRDFRFLEKIRKANIKYYVIRRIVLPGQYTEYEDCFINSDLEIKLKKYN